VCVVLVLYCHCIRACCGVWCVRVSVCERKCVRRVGPVLPHYSCLQCVFYCVFVCVSESVYMRHDGPVMPLHPCLL